ncbi:MAG: hypothetical protein PF518_00705 [Spirochaetaceae bacterium]|jgi:hypothetical protein|nr:hypothetical protein [Spirochaetaceae bacterium]
MEKNIILLSLAVLLVSCASAPSPKVKPRWVDDKYSMYPEAEYMVEIGQGSSLKDAKRNGAASLAAIFKSSIKVETTVQTRYKELAANGSVEASEETTFDQDITQLADQELINVNYGESWTNDLGQVNILTYIDRMATGNIYRDRIKENNSTVNSFLSRSKGESSLIRKYAYIDAAYVVAQGNQILMDQLDIINLPLRRSLGNSYDLDDVRINRKDTAQNMAFKINIENDTEGKVSSVIVDELTSYGFVIDPEGALSVSGRIDFENVKLDNGYENVKYYLTVNIEDEKGIPAVALEQNDRISAVSVSDAKNRSYLEIGKLIKNDLMGQLTGYFDSFVK